ncbi:hypothetical protein B0H16DRAFT_1726503 [Mycena metata]|uniref:Uncharacterized protein n=1 Tax=Mycena metata TaxID=1033252 RepID=A0AAD7IM35_9AGAR|nr:hypothetical protein B0H16DRAFT_1726503 [Mycena metata]
MQISEVVAVGVFCSYFSVIAGLFLLIARSLSSQNWGGRAYVFIALAVVSFVHTWFYSWLHWSFTDYEQSVRATISPGLTVERMSQWLLNTSLFEQAWAHVCFGKANWWWSQQLCLFTAGVWTIFLSIEGRRHHIKLIWVYMLLGQFVAISVASNLFYLALVLAPRLPSPSSSHGLSSLPAPVALWLPVLLSLGTVATSPFTSEHSFLPNLLLMHTLIILPLLVPDRLFPLAQASAETKSHFAISLKTLYIIVFGAALVLHARATGQAAGDPLVSVRDFALKAWDVLHSHPAQSSIGWDVIWTSISFVVWLVLHPELQPQVLPSSSTTRGRFLTVMYLTMVTPLLSVGVLAPHVFWTT